MIRIPSDAFESFIEALVQIEAEIEYQNISSKDVSEEFIDLETRLKNKHSYLLRYRELLGEAKNVQDILEVEEKIRLITEEIEKVRQNPRCHLRYNDTYPYRGWVLEDVGMYLDDVSQYLGSLINQDHEEQKGRADETFSRRKAWLEKNRRLDS